MFEGMSYEKIEIDIISSRYVRECGERKLNTINLQATKEGKEMEQNLHTQN